MAAPVARALPVGAFRPRVRAPPRRALRASPTPGRGGGGPAGRATRAQPPPRATAPSSASDDGDAAVLARVAATSTTAVDAWAALAAAGAAPADESGVVAVLDALLAAGNADAAIAVHAAASTAPAAAAMGLAGSWPRCGPRAASSLVVGLARLLRGVQRGDPAADVRSRARAAADRLDALAAEVARTARRVAEIDAARQ
jgi:hypothetical protein